MRIRVALAALAFDEVINYSFVTPRDLAILTPEATPILLKNPISADLAAMTTTRLAGLLGNVRHNLNRQLQDVRLYEVGCTYRPPTPEEVSASLAAHEVQVLAGAMVGNAAPRRWNDTARPLDFFDLKGAVEGLLETMHVRGAVFDPIETPLLHPQSACRLSLGGTEVGIMGELHPKVARALDLPRGVWVFEFELAGLTRGADLIPRYVPVPRFPAVTRDIALVLDARVPCSQVEAAIREAGGAMVEEVLLFDVYRGGSIPSGKRSLAFALRLRHPDRTLNDEEVAHLHASIVKHVSARCGAELRL